MKKNLYIKIILTVIAVALVVLIFEPTVITPRLQLTKWYRKSMLMLKYQKAFPDFPLSRIKRMVER